MAALAEQQLGQLRPANTTAATIYSPGANETAIIRTIFVCNTTATDATFRIFVDDNGTTYDQTTALYYDVVCPLNTTVDLKTYIAMDDATGNLAVRTGTNDAINFTVFGAVVT